MPRLGQKECATFGCHVLLPAGTRHCAEHERPYRWSKDTRSRDKRGGAEWRRLRRVVLKGRPWCVLCGAAPATEVDHRVPVSRGGAVLDLENLQPVCGPCHRRKSSQEGSQAAQARR